VTVTRVSNDKEKVCNCKLNYSAESGIKWQRAKLLVISHSATTKSYS